MNSKAQQPKEYIEQLPEERKIPMEQLRKAILDNLPDGFAETMTYGMIGFVPKASLRGRPSFEISSGISQRPQTATSFYKPFFTKGLRSLISYGSLFQTGFIEIVYRRVSYIQ